MILRMFGRRTAEAVQTAADVVPELADDARETLDAIRRTLALVELALAVGIAIAVGSLLGEVLAGVFKDR
jgi:hypothetical protein